MCEKNITRMYTVNNCVAIHAFTRLDKDLYNLTRWVMRSMILRYSFLACYIEAPRPRGGTFAPPIGQLNMLLWERKSDVEPSIS